MFTKISRASARLADQYINLRKGRIVTDPINEILDDQEIVEESTTITTTTSTQSKFEFFEQYTVK